MQTNTTEQYLTLRQASEAYQISERTLQRWIANGLLPAYRVGPRFVRVRPADLERLRTRIPAAS